MLRGTLLPVSLSMNNLILLPFTLVRPSIPFVLTYNNRETKGFGTGPKCLVRRTFRSELGWSSW